MIPFRLYKSYLGTLTLLLLAALPLQLLAQKKITARAITDKNITSLSKVFKKYSLININTPDLAQYVKSKSFASPIDIDLSFPGLSLMNISVQRKDILSSTYKLTVATPQGKQVSANHDCITYAGKLSNDNNSSVYLTITDKTIHGFIKGNGKEYFIEPLRYFNKQAAAGTFVLYETKDVIQNSGLACGVKEAAQKLNQLNTLKTEAARATVSCRLIEIALASDESMFLKYGSAEEVEEHNISVLNAMTAIYSNDPIGSSYLSFKLVEQYVATTSAGNPLLPNYDGNGIFTLLDNFVAWGEAGNFNSTYDLGQLWSARNADDFIDGLVVNIGTVCTSTRYNVCKDLGGSLSYLAALSAHEVGHCLGALHDVDPFAPFIMGNLWINPTPTTFSSTSLTQMDTYISNSGVTCLSACNAPPIAKFSVSGVTIADGQMQTCIDNSITFTDNSFGEVTDIVWSFQDGTAASPTRENPLVTFNTPGLKTVTLTVSNAFGSSTISETISVNGELMDGTLSASAAEVCRGMNFTLTYTGELGTARLQGYEQNGWVTYGLVRGPTLTLKPLTNVTFERLRIIIPGSPCSKVSNTVQVNYLPVPKPVVSGPDFICLGGSATLQVSDINLNEPPYVNYEWSPGSGTTSQITVNPVASTLYTATVTGANGCKRSASKYVLIDPSSAPVIQSTMQGKICAGTPTTLSFTGTKTVTGCTNSVLPQFPSNAVSVADCNGNYQLITTAAYAGEYSMVNVEAGKYYAFKILSSDIITVSTAAGNNILATGTSMAVWKSSFTGQVRYYSHKENCVAESTDRTKYIACSVSASSFGSFKWMPGGQTTDAITISPESTTSYSLTFTNATNCPATSTIEVEVEIPITYYRDNDEDGFGNPNEMTKVCSGTPPSGYVNNSNDCNDNDIEINPATVWIRDNDQDGYYNSSSVRCTSPGTGYIIISSQLAGDCNDNDPAITPAAVEVCGNRIDDNCNGVVDEGTCYACKNATSFSTTNVTSNSAMLNWVSIPNPNLWQIQYKSTKPGSKWVDVKPDHNR